MDEFLANLYGTNGYGEDTDVEKLAQAEMLTKIAEENEIDLEQLSDDQVAALADQAGLDFGEGAGDGAGGEIDHEIFEDEEGNQFAVAGDEEGNPHILAEDGNWYPTAEMGFDFAEDDGITAEASASFEEADFLGRVMAHSYHDESEKITMAKEAAGGKGIAKGIKQVGKAMGRIGRKKRILRKAKAPFQRYGQLMAGGAKGGTPGFRGYTGRPAALRNLRGALKAGGKRRSEAIKSLTARGLTGAGAIGAGAYGLKKASSVEDSLLESMARDRAVNFLAQYDLSEHGYDFEPVEEVKVASQVVNEHVDQLATQLVIDEGFGALLNQQ
jgi:hypothetical protein